MENPVTKIFILLIIIILLFQLPITATSNFDEQDNNDYTNYPENIAAPNPDWDRAITLNFEAELETIAVGDQVYDFVNVEDCLYTYQPGQPQLPVKVLNFKLENRIQDLQVEQINPKYIPTLNLAPARELSIFSAEGARASPAAGLSNTPNYLIDENSGVVPEIAHRLNYLGAGKFEEQKYFVYNLEIYPLTYDPTLLSGILYQNALIRLDFEEIDEQNDNEDTSSDPSHSTRGPRSMGSREEYIIITTDRLKDDLQPLADWKTRKGIPTVMYDIVTISTDPDIEGNDVPEKLRNFIRDKYNNFGLKYVLLAGDYNTVPSRMTHDPNPYGADDGEIPADTYYACIDEGTNWDTNGNGIYGEIGDLDDIIPEVYVGRIAINSDTGMREWVQEMLRYEREPVSGTWGQNTTLLGTNLFYSGDGAQHSEYLYSKYLQNVFGSFDKLYEDSTKSTEPFSVSNVMNAIGRGTTFINYMGHGGPTTWTYNYGYTKLMNKGDVRDLTNGAKKPVVFAMSCDTNWFDDSSDSGWGNFGDCIGETYTEFQDNGGVAYIGFSRTTVGSINQGYTPYATGLQEDFCRMLNRGYIHLGEIFMESKKFYSQSWGGYFNDTSSSGEVQACWLEENLLGEPELPIWTQVPQKFNVTNETLETGVMVTVKDENNEVVEDAVVCLYAEDVLYVVNRTNVNGRAMFHIVASGLIVNLTVTKPNFLPYESKMKVADIIPPETGLEVYPAKPDGKNDWYCTLPLINLTTEPKAVTYYRWELEGEEDGSRELQNYTFLAPITPPEGIGKLIFYSIDDSNNIEPEQSYQFKVDTISPQTNISIIPGLPDGDNGWFNSYPEVYLSSPEIDGRVYYRWEGHEDVNSSSDAIITTAPPSEGIQTLYYFSEDNAGNLESESTLVLKIDTLPSETNLEVTPDIPNGNNDWYISAPSITLSTDENSTIYYSWDAELNQVEITLNSFNRYSSEILTAPEGLHELNYFSIDQAGNMETPKNVKFKLDTEAPISSLKITPSEPDGDDGWYISEVEISLKCNDKLFSHISQQTAGNNVEPEPTIYYHWDNLGSIKKYTGNITVPEGAHTLYYYSEDAAGNIEPECRYDLKLDTTPPETKIVVEPTVPDGENYWFINVPTVSFKIEDNVETGNTADEDAEKYEGGTIETYYYWDNPDAKPKSYSRDLRAIEGQHTLYYFSVDIAGNIETVSSYEFKVDLIPPYPVLSVDTKTILIGEHINFDASGSFDVNGISGYYIDFGDGEVREWLPSAAIDHRYELAGEYEVILFVKDNAGRVSDDPATVSISVFEEPEDQTGEEGIELNLMIMPLAIGIILIIAGLLMVNFMRKGAADADKRASYRDYDEYASPRKQRVRETEMAEVEPAEAIIIDKPIVIKIQKVQCPKCSKIFKMDPKRDEIKCPTCGAEGKIKSL